MNIYDRVIHIVDAVHKAGFTSLAYIFIYQFSNFHPLPAYDLDVIQSIISKPNLVYIQFTLQRPKDVFVYCIIFV